MKKSHFEPIDRNSEKSINKRYNRASNFIHTDMDYQNNCIFIGEYAFHINFSYTMVWPHKSTRFVSAQPKTRAKTTKLGAIASYGIINIKVSIPYTVRLVSFVPKK